MFLKDPAARLDFGVDWMAALPSEVGLAASNWQVHPAETGGVTVEQAAIVGAEATVCLAGGIAGQVYRICNRVTFTNGHEDERMLVLRVEDR